MKVIATHDKDGLSLAYPDMCRWWRNHCIRHNQTNGVFIELKDRSARHLAESVKRLKSFGVVAWIQSDTKPLKCPASLIREIVGV